ncbi:MAG: penicillin acylase family protein [Thermoleophilaceae bacterium]
MALATATVACAVTAAPVQAQLGGGLLPLPGGQQVPAYQADDGRGFRNILPPGQNGLINGPQLGAFAAGGARPAHSDDQLKMYSDLVFATPGISAGNLDNFFKDASFGVRPGDIERSYSPRGDVTILRDKGFGVPHVYGTSRAGSMFGAGYVGGEDRLFFMDVLRNLGRGSLSTFAGGANREMDREQWLQTPYTEADLQRQVDQLDDLYGAEGKQIQDDAAAYVDGINAYIQAAKLNPALMPGEYAAIGRPAGPEPWSARDVIATAALVGGIFGKGGGRELDSAMVYQEARRRFGKRVGTRVWRDFRAAEDPEAPTTIRKRFPYQVQPKRVRKGSVALPDRGSVKKSKAVEGASASASTTNRPLDGLLAFPTANSNALLVSARESQSGKPIAVMGPQTGYFAPQILMEIDIHGPGIDARGASFPGVNLYVQLGRGRDYAFSATSAGQDIIDTFAAPLCDPAGGKPTLASMHYRFRGKCEAIEVLERRNTWMSSAGDPTPSGSETLRAERTKLGIVTARATIKGKPVVYTKLRSTYLHEVDSARGFVDFNDPAKMRNAQDFKRAAAKIGYAFNWLYADDRDIAYYNSGNNPVRAKGVDTSLPTQSKFPWRRYDADNNLARYTSFAAHPNVTNQSFLTSWNNKQAPGFRAADANFEYTSIYRSEPLDDRIRAKIRGKSKMNLPQLVDAMETSGVVDLRADKVLPFLLTALGKPRDPALRGAMAKLRAWRRDGSLRKDANRDGVYEHTEAIRILDAWWPKLVEAQFAPTLGKPLLERFLDIKRLDNDPNNHGEHLGSAYQGGTYGLVEKDLRTLLGRKRLRRAGFSRGLASVRGKYSRVYCGATKRRKATLRHCRRALSSSLKSALGVGADKLYGDKVCASQPGLGPKDPGRKALDQYCFDSVRFRPLGAAEQPLIHWINRPTFQQILEIQSHRPR